MKKDCIVIGMGQLGSNIAQMLNSIGKNVTVVDKDIETFDMLENFSGFMVSGDATDLSFLESVGVKNAGKVILTTENYNINIFLAHVLANVYNVPEIFCRLNSANKNVLLNHPNIKIINPFSLCMEYFSSLVEN